MLSGRISAIDVACDFFVSISAFCSMGTAIIPPPLPKSPLAIPVIEPRM
jgi:hypothetical protein